MNKPRFTKRTLLSAVIVISGFSALAAVNLTSFTPGTPIKAAEMNGNFSSIKTAIEALEAPGGISSAQLASGGADGKVLKLAGGKPTWADDLTGSGGGTAFSAGSGLALTGSTFSIADGGVTSSKLSASGGADGKVLKLSSGNLVWSDDQVGSGGGGGTTYSADGSSLQLSGTTFSIKDGGVSSAQLAVPLSMNGSAANSGVLSATNTSATPNAVGLLGRSIGASGKAPGFEAGVWGDSSLGYGIYASSSGNISLFAANDTRTAIKGFSTSGIGVEGSSSSSTGLTGSSTSGRGVEGRGDIGVIGISDSRAVIGTQGVISCPGAYAVGGCATTNNAASFHGGSGGNGTCTYAGGAGWNCASDRNLKENFRAVSPRAVLERLQKMPVSRWNMIGDSSKTPHLGPMAQDFKAAFGLGDSDKTINTADAQGVALTAIKGLAEVVQEKDAQIVALSSKLSALEARLDALERR